jgi:CheY-specific phosphatase CheX/CheY-like chemotaxis protein
VKSRRSSVANVEKHVLLVDDPGGTLCGLLSQFNQLGYRVLWVPSASAALALLACSPKLSLLVASVGTEQDRNDEFFAKVRELEPGLRIIRGVRASSSDPMPMGTTTDTLVREPFHADELRSATARLLAEHFDLQPAADAARLAALEVLGPLGSFRVVGNVFLKANEAVLSDFAAMIPFSGDLCGHVIMSMTSRDAQELHHRFVPNILGGPTLDRLEDLVGELCNQIVGGILGRFSTHALNVNHTTPVFIRSVGGTLRYRGRQPSLGIELSDGTVRTFVELYLEEFDGTKLGAPVTAEVMPPNEIRFF